MSIEAVGVVTVLIGVSALWRGPTFAFAAFVPMTLLGAAAAVLLGGSGTIQPAHLMLGFLALTAAGTLDFGTAREQLRFPREGFWLVAFTVLAVGGAVLLPRLLAETTNINAIGSTDYGPSIMLVPLGPTSGNMTQSVYTLADLACFLLCVAYAGQPAGFERLVRALTAYCACNIAFALVDLATFWTNTGFLLAPIRNADYQLHIETVVTGLKRIVGSFTETSSFSYATLGALGFTAELCLVGVRPRLFGPLALASLALLTLSTSTTAYVATPLLLLVLYGRTLARATHRRATALGLTVLMLGPLAVAAVTAGILLDPASKAAVMDTLTALLFDKAASQSGMERGAWNTAALQNAFDTHGLGAGLGSVRASSFPIALLANTGVPGFALLGAFLLRLLLWPSVLPGVGWTEPVRGAARVACVGLLIGATISGALVDLGLPFYTFAALACADPRRSAMVPIPSPPLRRICPVWERVTPAGSPAPVAPSLHA